jgi:hypothetical protein
MKDTRHTVIPISVGLQYELLWEVEPIAPRLREIFLRMDDVDDPHNDPHLLKILSDRYDPDDQ